MAQSQNSTVELTVKATSFIGLTSSGDMMLGNRALEFYNERNPEDFIQIPWDEIHHVAASVLPGKRISRFAVFTRDGASFTFSTRDNKRVLRQIREHVPAENLVRSRSFPEVISAGVRSIPGNVAGLIHRGR